MSLPCPVNLTSFPHRENTGIRKRSVLPDSEQSSTPPSYPEKEEVPVTSIVSGSGQVNFLPRCERQAIVALVSSFFTG